MSVVDLATLLGGLSNDITEVLTKNPPYEDRDDLAAEDLPDAGGETWYRIRRPRHRTVSGSTSFRRHVGGRR